MADDLGIILILGIVGVGAWYFLLGPGRGWTQTLNPNMKGLASAWNPSDQEKLAQIRAKNLGISVDEARAQINALK